MNIAEIFYTLQGEGMLAGVPSVFIRTSGCNLRCRWCDTPYTSWRPEARGLDLTAILAEVERHPTRYCVLTGGEPMIAAGIAGLAAGLRARGKHITIETNGTMLPEGIEADLVSLSPKLANATPDPASFPREARLHRPEARLCGEVVSAWLREYDCQLKFVIADAVDVEEMRAFLDTLEVAIPPERVLLMPEGVDVATLAQRREMLVALCKRHGYRYCSRLHIELFGNQRGT